MFLIKSSFSPVLALALIGFSPNKAFCIPFLKEVKDCEFFVDVSFMRRICYLLLPSLLFSATPFDTPKEKIYNLSVFNTKKSVENKKAIKNKRINCRYICDKKLYNEQKIEEAILFYKKEKTTK